MLLFANETTTGKLKLPWDFYSVVPGLQYVYSHHTSVLTFTAQHPSKLSSVAVCQIFHIISAKSILSMFIFFYFTLNSCNSITIMPITIQAHTRASCNAVGYTEHPHNTKLCCTSIIIASVVPGFLYWCVLFSAFLYTSTCSEWNSWWCYIYNSA